MKKYLIVIEETGAGYAAYSPDLPGCVSSGRTRNEVERNLRAALALHLNDLREEANRCPNRILIPLIGASHLTKSKSARLSPGVCSTSSSFVLSRVGERHDQ